MKFDQQVVRRFALALAQSENLAIIYPSPGGIGGSEEGLFQLKPSDGAKVIVTIRGFFPERRLWISAMNNFDPARAEEVIFHSITIAEHQFPGIRIERVKEKKGILGP